MLDATHWDSSLIRRYDYPGPRYTSYPTAVQFHGGVSAFDLLAALRSSRRESRPLSLYVHLPFCADICYYCACNKIVTKDRSKASDYLDRLEKEIALVACHVGKDQLVEQLHLGGGTPTFLSHDQLRRLMAMLKAHFRLVEHGDFSIEIDPREADWATMGLLRELGFNRVSLGVQDLDPQVQQAIHRHQTLKQTQTLIEAARTLQYHSINLDMIYGLPKQNLESFRHGMQQVIELQPDRLSLFNYAHLPQRFKPQRRILQKDLPSPSEKLAILQSSIEQLTQAGYRYIGMDHFALPDDELAIAQEDGLLQRNFQGYTTHGHCDLIGLGVSAISQIGDLYSQNDSRLDTYHSLLDSQVLPVARGYIRDEDDRLRGAVIQALICSFELKFADIENRFGIQFRSYFSAVWPRLQQMAQDGLIRLQENGIDVLPPGRLLVRSLCMLFDRYLDASSQQGFSRVI